MQSEHAFKVPLLFLAVGCIMCGFVVGFKLTTHIYQGSQSLLYCGFPFPVGFVELQSGQDSLRNKASMTLRMALNALVGVSLTLFPAHLHLHHDGLIFSAHSHSSQHQGDNA